MDFASSTGGRALTKMVTPRIDADKTMDMRMGIQFFELLPDLSMDAVDKSLEIGSLSSVASFRILLIRNKRTKASKKMTHAEKPWKNPSAMVGFHFS